MQPIGIMASPERDMYNEEESIYDLSSVSYARHAGGYNPLGEGGAYVKGKTGRKWAQFAQRRAINPLLRRFPFLYTQRHLFRRAALLLFVILPIIFYVLLAYLVPTAAVPTEISAAKSALLVVAHPDDECLFFSPILNRIKENGAATRLSILVMSVGNNYGLGEQRRAELAGSCAAFGVPTERCKALDEPDIQDDPQKWWPTDKIEKLIRARVEEWNVDLLLTFDNGGISGHTNHRAVSESVRQLVQRDPAKAPAAYVVYTVALPRKYTLIFDLGLSALRFLPRILLSLLPFTGASGADSGIAVNSLGKWMNAIRAFKSHSSQWEIARSLFLVFNRYMWFNTLDKVT